MVLDLQKEVLTEELPQFQGAVPGLGGVPVQYGLGNLTGETAGEADETLCVGTQQLPVNAGLHIKALGEAGAD